MDPRGLKESRRTAMSLSSVEHRILVVLCVTPKRPLAGSVQRVQGFFFFVFGASRVGFHTHTPHLHLSLSISLGLALSVCLLSEDAKDTHLCDFTEVCTNQIPLCYIIGFNILRYQALPWHNISYQEKPSDL